MSTSKKRNLKRRIVGCFCISAIAANMAAPVIPVISDMGVITAEATFQPGGTITQYTVTFNTNGGSDVTMQLVQSGQLVNLPTPPTRENCTFGGWYTDANLTNEYDFTKEVTDNITLYAKWIVNIDLNDLLAAAGTSPSYDSTGVTVEYRDDSYYIIQLKESFYKISGSNLVNDAYVDVRIQTDYSVPNTYIEFDNASIINSACFLMSGKLFSVNPFFTNIGTTLTISGKLNIDTLSIYDGEKYNIRELDRGFGNLVIDSFTVKFVDEDGVTVDENYYLNGYNYDVTTTGYTDKDMNEYSISEEFPCMKVPETVSDNTTVNVSKTHSDPDNNGNCKACEKHIAEKVTFVTNGGSDIDPVVVLTGKTVEKPADPTKEKSNFGGWYTDVECTSAYDFTVPVDKDITLYAKWTAWAVDSIAVKTAPTKTDYIEGEEFDPTGLVITVTYDSGKTEDIAYGTENAADFTVTPSGALAVSDTSVTITYGGKSTEQKIAVSKAEVSDIVIKTAPTKTNYVEGEKFDLTGLVLTVTYNNGKTEDIAYGKENAADFTVTPSGALAVSDTSITITYGGKTVNVDVTVKKGEVDVKPSEDNFGGAQIDMPIEDLIDAVLDDDDRELIEQGVDISVLMATVTIDPEIVPETDKQAIDDVLNDFSIGCYLDVNLFKRYSNGDPDKKVTDPSAAITISFEVPQYILDKYPKDEYVYSVFCSHNGVGYPVESRYDADTNIMTFSSDKFSIYALGVMPEEVEEEYNIKSDSHIKVVNSAKEGETVTVIVDEGYKAVVTDAKGNVITEITGTGTFTMPASDVTITAEKISKPDPVKYYSIYTDSHVWVDSTKHKEGDTVNYRVDNFYEAVLYVNGAASSKLSGSGSFTMPAADVRIVSGMDEITYAMFTTSVENSYVYSYDTDMNLIKTSGTRKKNNYIIIDLGEEYAGRSITIYKGRKSTKTIITEGVLDKNGIFKFENAGFGTNYTLIIGD